MRLYPGQVLPLLRPEHLCRYIIDIVDISIIVDISTYGALPGAGSGAGQAAVEVLGDGHLVPGLSNAQPAQSFVSFV